MKTAAAKFNVMKPLVIAITAALGCARLLQAATLETPFEFQLDADLDGDGRIDAVIVDKASGAFRAGYQTAPGLPTWSEARPTGAQDITGVNAGRLLSLNRDALAVASPAANRISLVEATNTTDATLPLAIFPPSIGPNAVGVIDIGGAGNTAHADLYVITRENPGPRETLFRNNAVLQTLLGDNSLGAYRSSPGRLELKSGQPQRLGLFQRAPAGGTDAFVVIDLQAGVATALFTNAVSLPNTPRVPEFVSARFNAQPLAQVLFYQPGTNVLRRLHVSEPVPGTFGLVTPLTYAFTSPVQSVAAVPGPADTRLLVLFGDSATNATIATVFSYDGTNTPVPVQSYTNLAGFSGASALGTGNFALLGGDGSGRSADFAVKLRSGNGYVDGASGALPAVTPYSGNANVLLMSAEPFVSPAARPVRQLRAGEWSSSIAFTGAPTAKVLVRAERYGGVSNGLVNPVPTVLGNVPAGVAHALVNQYTNPISIFSLSAANGDQPGRVSVSPPSGEYQSAIQVTIATTPATWVARYRFSTAAAWQTYSGPLTIFTNATLECYAVDSLSLAKTAVEKVVYSFTDPANAIDSDGDSVPDAVEVAKGIDPRRGRDTDGDGFSDLEEVLAGTNPNSTNSKPAQHFEIGGNFLRVVAPSVPDGAGTMRLGIHGMNVRAWSVSSVFLAGTNTANQFQPDVPPSAARLLIKPADGDELVLETTDFHFGFFGGSSTQQFGREVVGAFRVPALGVPELPTLDPSLSPAAISAWILSASNVLATYPQPRLPGELTPLDTATALMLERVLANALVQRGTNYGTNATLFGFRTPDAARVPLDAGDLSRLESYAGPLAPAYRAGTVFDYLEANILSNAAPNFAALRSVTHEFWRASSAHHSFDTNALPLPLDVLRQFIADGTLNTNYTPFFSQAAQLPAAFAAVQTLLASAPARPTSNMIVEVVSIAPGVPATFRVLGTATPVALWKAGGVPCALPTSINLVPGSQLAVFGFPDVPEAPGTLGVEVINLALASVPVVSATDLDGDLLLDAWENVFLGGNGDAPFGDTDGDGYSDLQEMLAGTDPNNPGSRPAVPRVNFSTPVVNLEPSGNQLKLVFNWPAGYAGFFNFGVTSTDDLGGAFIPLTATPAVQRVGDTFEVTLTPPDGQWGDPHRFFILNVGLR